MSIKATFWRYEKPIDSTARPGPGDTDKEEFEIVLKAPASITAPVIELTNAALRYNYCYIPRFGRYYFVHNTVTMTNEIIQYTLAEDLLATWREEILNSNLYVIRSASDYNLKLVDDTWTHTSDFTENVTTAAFPNYNDTGCYIITVVNASTRVSANPASQMYVINNSNLTALLAEMFDLGNYNNIDDLTATYFNPGQYITSCRWLPFSYDYVVSLQDSTVPDKIKYGWYTAERAEGVTVTTYGLTLNFTISLGAYSKWTDRDANWTRYALFVPGFGITEIDPAFSGQSLSGKISIDFNTTQANLMLTTGTNQIASQLSGKVGAEVALNQVGGSIDIPTSIGGLIGKGIQIGGGTIAKAGTVPTAGALVKLLSFSGIGGALAAQGLEAAGLDLNTGRDVAAAAADAAKQSILNPTVTTVGADGCRYTIIDNHTIILYRRQYTHYNPAFAKLGGVCNQVKHLGNLSGYTQVANGLIDMAGTIEERNGIASILEGGFIIA